jgi:putative DNA primase/helicase
MVRDPLVWLGEDDPWKSTDMAREEDPELSDIREFFDSGVMDIDHHYKTQRIIDLAADDETKALLIRVSDSSGPLAEPYKLGMWLRRISGRPVDGMRLMAVAGDKKRPKWRLTNMPAKAA